jgi:signal transduction histidine kinase
MGQEGDWRGEWADRARRITASPHALVGAGALLGLGAVAETIARATGTLPAVTESITRAAHTSVNARSLVLSLLAASFLALATTLPLAFLRPAAAAVIMCSASMLSFTVVRTLGTLTVAGLGALLIALYRLGRNGSPRRGARLLAPGLAAPFLILALIAPAGAEARVLIILLASLGPAAAWAGISAQARSEALMHNAARQDIADTLIEHTARGERARIARELHDVVAHHISMIAVQAETARLTTPEMPAAGAQRLTEIGATARAGLTEMRRLLGVLREDAEADVADRHPQPGLDQLNELLDEARDNASAVTRLIVSGSPLALDPGAELAAYRIVQEALTNARRHAPGAAVDVELRYAGDALQLRIRDNGPGLAKDARTSGHGLHGMRERATSVGGELRTGRAAGGGFVVEATLPAKADTAK